MRHPFAFLIAITCVSLSFSLRASAIEYTYTSFDAPIPGLVFTELNGINDRGDIVGNYSIVGTTEGHGFLYRNGTFMTLDVPFADVRATFPHGINESGQIVGSYNQGGGDHGFMYSSGNFSGFDVPFPGIRSTLPRGINSMGQIVGGYTLQNPPGQVHGFSMDSSGHFTTIDFPPGGWLATLALAINDRGEIVGHYNAPDNHGYILVNGNFTSFDVALTTPGPTVPFGINNAGDIVGTTSERGFIRDVNGRIGLIDFPSAQITRPADINNSGQIVGTYVLNGLHGFIATPIPEPSSMLLLASGLATLIVASLSIKRRSTGA